MTVNTYCRDYGTTVCDNGRQGRRVVCAPIFRSFSLSRTGLYLNARAICRIVPILEGRPVFAATPGGEGGSTTVTPNSWLAESSPGSGCGDACSGPRAPAQPRPPPGDGPRLLGGPVPERRAEPVRQPLRSGAVARPALETGHSSLPYRSLIRPRMPTVCAASRRALSRRVASRRRPSPEPRS